jgi:hypothetical protein
VFLVEISYKLIFHLFVNLVERNCPIESIFQFLCLILNKSILLFYFFLNVLHISLNLVDILNLLLRRGLNDCLEHFLDLKVLLLQILDLKKHLLVFALEFEEFGGHFDVLKHIAELADELINLVNELRSDAHQTRSDLLLPSLNRRGVYHVGEDGVLRQFFYSLKLVHLLLVRFVNVQQVVFGYQTLHADVSFFLLGKKHGGSIVLVAKHLYSRCVLAGFLWLCLFGGVLLYYELPQEIFIGELGLKVDGGRSLGHTYLFNWLQTCLTRHSLNNAQP